MLTILLVRSGMTEFDSQGRIQGTLDVPLSDEGRQQAEAAADDLAERARVDRRALHRTLPRARSRRPRFWRTG